MLRVLLTKANDPNPTVSANVLMALGELSCIGGEDVMPHVPDLMAVILSSLADPTLVKRDAALHTLGQVCSSTGYVITPLIDHPQLLQTLGRILRTEPTQAVRREVIKVLGILGALDPYKRRVRFHLHLARAFLNFFYRVDLKTKLLQLLANWRRIRFQRIARSPIRTIITRP